MMCPDEYRRHRALWIAVLYQAVENHRRRCAAARRGEEYAATTSGSSREQRLGLLDDEIDAARRYFTSKDGREVIDNSGLSVNVDKLLHYIATADKAISAGDLA